MSPLELVIYSYFIMVCHNLNDLAIQHGKSQNNLLVCFSFITAYYGHAYSCEALVQHLKGGSGSQVHAPALKEVALSIGFEADIFERAQLNEISVNNLPAIIQIDKADGFVLLARENEICRIYDPASHQEREVSLEQLEKLYSGKVIFVKAKQVEAHAHTDQTAAQAYSNKWFWAFFKDNKKAYRLAVFASVLINLFALTAPIFIMNMYDRVIPNSAIETGWALAIGALIVFGFDFLMRILRAGYIDLAGRRIDVLAGAHIYDHILNMRLSERPASSGVFASMLKEFDAVRDFLTAATLVSVVDLPFTLFFIVIIALIGGTLAFIPLAVIVIVLLIGYCLQRIMKGDVIGAMRAGEKRHGVLIETINSLETVKAIGADRRLRSLYTESLGDMARYGQATRHISNIGASAAMFMQQVMTVLLVLAGMYMVKDNSLSMGALIACVILSGRAVSPIGQVANLMTRFYQARGALNNISGLMNKAVDRSPSINYVHRPALNGDVHFDKVCFSYPNAQREILHDISFTIKRGEKLAIIGRIGSGKSTIARLIMGLYTPDSGQILIDGTAQEQIDPADLRRDFSYITQDVTLFRGTLRENMTISRLEASEAEILDVAKRSGVYDFAARHPLGFDLPVGEGGAALSGGQRQAVALARAMLCKPALYVCDEPTNAMDVEAEMAFTKHVQGEVQDKTLILITHRLSLLSMVDRIIMVDQGKIVMDGSRDQVIAQLSSTPQTRRGDND